MMERQSIYWRDEFAVEIGLTAERDGETVPADIPPFDWGARIFTPDSTRHVAISQKDGVAHGWSRTDDGKILVHLDRHGLMPGPLIAEFSFLLPDGGYPDGNQRLTRHYDLGVDLTTDDRDVPTAAEATLKVPWQLIKGDKGDPLTYADLTEADKADLAPLIAEDTDAEADDILPGVVQSAVRFTGQALTPGERAQALRNLGEPQMMQFIRMWNAAAGEYGKYDPVNAPDAEHPFLLNGLWLSWREAIDTYLYARDFCNHLPLRDDVRHEIRTNLLTQESNLQYNHAPSRAFFNFSNLRVARLGPDNSAGTYTTRNIKSAEYLFHGCLALEEVVGGITLSGMSNLPMGAFTGCSKLRTLKMYGLAFSINLSMLKALSLESISVLARNAANTSAITVTLHPSAFERLTDDLIAAAQVKNIAFVTP